ncbi:MAG: hypothetical protein M1608_06595 [Candidatus Omnitrophica bacterium]|nr:hypothetical protein [Candidatus Omnitrophota bacterium]
MVKVDPLGLMVATRRIAVTALADAKVLGTPTRVPPAIASHGMMRNRISSHLLMNNNSCSPPPRHGTAYQRCPIVRTTLLIFAIVLQSCSTKPAIPDFDKVLDGFGSERPVDKPESLSMEANIFVNLAQSMKGFAITSGSNYRRVLEGVLAETTAQQYALQKFRFAGGAVSAADNFTAAHFLDPTNYTGASASLGLLLEQVVRQRQYERINIIVGDLAEPDGTPGHPSVAPSLRALASKGVEVVLLGFRSAYQGEYPASAIACANRRLQMQANQSLPGSGRPFYILAIAPNVASMNRLSRAVLEKLRPQVSFTPSSNPVFLESGALNPQPKISILDRTQRKKDYGTTRRFYSSFAVPSGREEITLPFKWVTTNVFDVDPAKLSFEIKSARPGKAGQFAQSTNDQLQVKASEDPNAGPGNMLFEYSLRPPDTSSFVVFLVQMRGGVGNLQLPRWVKDWSTEDDCGTATANRTYHLKLLGDALMSNFAQDTVFAEHYIAIRRK